jgi:hypothetical protein
MRDLTVNEIEAVNGGFKFTWGWVPHPWKPKPIVK